MTGLDLNKHFSLTSSSDVATICQPLSNLGVTYFNYIKIYNEDGSRELLTNNASWIEHFYRNSLYSSVGAIDVEYLLPKGYFLWSELDSDDPVYSQGRESFNIDNGVSFVVRREDITYLYIFASTRSNNKINNFYTRNIDLFKRFMLFFNEQASGLMKAASENRIYLPDKQVASSQKLNQIDISVQSREEFYEKTLMERFYLFTESEDFYLTRKQAECAAYLVAGATAKQCGKKLGISHRTVQGYIDDIKNKIYYLSGGRPTKEELISFLKKAGVHDVVFSRKINLFED